jgi:hypothetical protein
MFKFSKGIRGYTLGGMCVAWGGGRGVQISLSRIRLVLHRGVRVLVVGYGYFEIIGWRVSAGFFN